MSYTIDITSKFEDDINAVIDYFLHTLYNSAAAERLINKAEKTILQIGENPLLFPLYHDEKIAEKGYRYTVISNYLIFYSVDESEKIIHILRFIYGGRNVSDILS